MTGQKFRSNRQWRTTLCWSCENATGGCTWADRLEPVKGWTAEKTVLSFAKKDQGRDMTSFHVTECPRFRKKRKRVKLHHDEMETLVFEELCNAVVLQAARDWRELCRGKSVGRETFGSICEFFNSDWGEAICGKVAPERILQGLEKERHEAEEEREKRKE